MVDMKAIRKVVWKEAKSVARKEKTRDARKEAKSVARKAYLWVDYLVVDSDGHWAVLWADM